MKNIETNDGNELDNIIYSINKLEGLHPGGTKNFILNNGQKTYAYRSEDPSSINLYYSDLTSIVHSDSIYNPGFISIVSVVYLLFLHKYISIK